MARLIDADRALEIVRDQRIAHPNAYLLTDYVTLILREAPTVDAVEVVRCRDCKWYMPGDLFTDIMFCHRLKKDNGKPAKYNYCADDFCSYGERKEGADR